MPSRNSGLPPLSKSKRRRPILIALERMRIRSVLLLAVFVILGSTAIYYLSAKVGLGGLHQSNGSENLGDSLYFSLVTFTSLGYGDIAPVGASRWVACVEVILGLSLFGLAVSKASAARQSYYLGRLYVHYATERFSSYERSLRDLKEAYRHAALELPIQRQQVMDLNVRLHGILHSVEAFISFEASQGDFFGEVSPSPILKILKPMCKVARRLKHICEISGGEWYSDEILRSARRRYLQMQKTIALVKSSSFDPRIHDECYIAQKVCGSCISDIFSSVETVSEVDDDLEND